MECIIHSIFNKFRIVVPLLIASCSDATFVFSKLFSAEKQALNLEAAAAHGQEIGNNIEQV